MIQVFNKYTWEPIATLEEAPVNKVDDILSTAVKGFRIMKNMPTYKRAEILEEVSSKLRAKQEDYARTIAQEAGKPLKYARREAYRASVTMKFSAEEAKRIYGEVIPFDAEPRGVNKFAYYIREPIGVVLAITPFNDPLNLVAHKLGPAIAAGNSVILKPATLTPLSAIKLSEELINAGLPSEALQVVITSGGGPVINRILDSDTIKMVTFTGGTEAADQIVRSHGIKKYAMELGNNSPVIVWEDADIDKAVPLIVDAGFESQGQNCIHAQRILIHEKIYDEVKEKLVKLTQNLKVGDPLDESTDVGPMITEAEAKRVEEWVEEAIRDGANLLIGHKRVRNIYYPTILENVSLKSRIAIKEVFGPVMLLFKVRDIDETINLANSTPYGLQAGIFTNNIKVAKRFIDELQFGGVLINDTSDFRVDFMPFGGYKYSGLGREGIRFAIEEMTEIKLVIYNFNP
ncbi:MAG: aldehyde dehydrogenase family protein [Vulcanisaeta sp.]|jgi:glyceraldehyde-3-phosphate dehydrogenase (NADP+)|uniref:aldehyde dehydrogenase family protein n=1 Tax=Vulcanisaeta sp. TaxID=2020871 RepID=UPI003D0F26FD